MDGQESNAITEPGKNDATNTCAASNSHSSYTSGEDGGHPYNTSSVRSKLLRDKDVGRQQEHEKEEDHYSFDIEDLAPAVAAAECGGKMITPQTSSGKSSSSATPVRMKSPLQGRKKNKKKYKSNSELSYLDSSIDGQSEELVLLSKESQEWISDHGTMTSTTSCEDNEAVGHKRKKGKLRKPRGLLLSSSSSHSEPQTREQQDLLAGLAEYDPPDPPVWSIVSKCIGTRKKGITCWTTYTVILSLLLALMATALGLMGYCLHEINHINETEHIPMSTSEVYHVNPIQSYHNKSYYTKKVCIQRVNKTLENVKVYLQHGRCSDLSTTTENRTIQHSFSSCDDVSPLNFYWLKDTNFSLKLTHQEPTNFIIYVHGPEYNDVDYYCTYNGSQGAKLNYSSSGNKKNTLDLDTCTDGDNTSMCLSGGIDESGRYYMCLIWESPNFINVSYILNINEIRYTNTSKFDCICCNDYRSCCSSFGNIIEEASNPTCMLIKTTTNGDNDNAYFLSQDDLVIETPRKWDGVTYPLYLFIILAAVFVPTVSLCCYTCYRKRHPQGYCLKLSVNDATCFC